MACIMAMKKSIGSVFASEQFRIIFIYMLPTVGTVNYLLEGTSPLPWLLTILFEWPTAVFVLWHIYYGIRIRIEGDADDNRKSPELDS